MVGKIVSWNVRGLNDRKKRDVVKGCMKRWNPDVVCLQETTMEVIDEREAGSLWGSKEKG